MYTDADFAGDGRDQKSTTGTLVTYYEQPIDCRSLKQSMIAISTTEAEYISMAHTVQNAK